MYSMSMEPLQMLCPSPLLQLHVLSLLLLLLVHGQREFRCPIITRFEIASCINEGASDYFLSRRQ